MDFSSHIFSVYLCVIFVKRAFRILIFEIVNGKPCSFKLYGRLFYPSLAHCLCSVEWTLHSYFFLIKYCSTAHAGYLFVWNGELYDYRVGMGHICIVFGTNKRQKVSKEKSKNEYCAGWGEIETRREARDGQMIQRVRRENRAGKGKVEKKWR